MESFEDRLARKNSYHRRVGREEGERIPLERIATHYHLSLEEVEEI